MICGLLVRMILYMLVVDVEFGLTSCCIVSLQSVTPRAD